MKSVNKAIIATLLVVSIYVSIVVLIYRKFDWLFTTADVQHEISIDSIDSDKALIVVIENNDYVSVDTYGDGIETKALRMLLGFLGQDAEGMDLAEMMDEYLEDYFAMKVLAYIDSYEKVVYLTDESSSYENFKEELKSLSEEGYTIDIFFSLHGSENRIWFYNESVHTHTITSDLKTFNPSIGFIYQTLCEGSTTLPMWEELGAEGANGAYGTNYYVLVAPIISMREISKGSSFEEAVIYGMNYEIGLYEMLGFIIPDAKEYISEDFLSGSEMKFLYE